MFEDPNVAAVPGQGTRDPDACLCCGLRSGDWDPGAPELGHEELSQLAEEARRLARSGWMRYFSVDCAGFVSGPLARRTRLRALHGRNTARQGELRNRAPPLSDSTRHRQCQWPLRRFAICQLMFPYGREIIDGCQCNLVQIDAGEIWIIWARPQSE